MSSPEDTLAELLHCINNYQSPDVSKLDDALQMVAPRARFSLLNTKGTFGHTAIHDAAFCGHTDVIKPLLRYTTAHERYNLLSIQNGTGNTAIDLAAINGHTVTINAMLESLGEDQKYEILRIRKSNGNTAVHSAAYKGHFQTIKTLLDMVTPEQQLALLQMQNKIGQTGQTRAVKFNKPEIAAFLQVCQALALEKIRNSRIIQDGDRDEMASILSRLDVLERSNEQKDAIISSIEERLEYLTVKLCEQCKQQDTNILQMNEQLNQEREKIRSLKERLKFAVDQMVSDCTALEAQRSQEESDSRDAKIKALDKQVTDGSKYIEELEVKLANTVQSLSDTKTALDICRTDITELGTRAYNLENEVEDIKTPVGRAEFTFDSDHESDFE